MTLLDANLLLYAYNATSEFHDRARQWLENLLATENTVALSWPVLLAFLRISSDARLHERPMSMNEAADIAHEWVTLSNVVILNPGPRHWEILRGLLRSAQVRGPLVTDAHLAALAVEHGATLATNDRDFSRFENLRVIYPLAG